jgi:hypothetical protein
MSTLDLQAAVQEIRALITDSETEAALDRTRQLLTAHRLHAPLVQLDMIESEYNSIREQHIHGILSLDDHMRLQNINRGKLMQLLLGITKQEALAVNLTPNAGVVVPAAAPPDRNFAFKNGLKMFVGVNLLLCTIGAMTTQNWLVACCFGIAGLITFPPTLRAIEKAVGYELLSWHKYLLVIVALGAAGNIYKPNVRSAASGETPELKK